MAIRWCQSVSNDAVCAEKTVDQNRLIRAEELVPPSHSCLHPTPASQQPLQPPADLVPAVVIPWDPIRPWRSHQPAAESQQDAHAAPAESVPAQQSLYIAGTFTGVGLDPMTWGFGSQPVHHFVVKAASLRHRILELIRMGDSHPRQPLRPAVWADTPGNPRSVLRRLEQHWAARFAARERERYYICSSHLRAD